MYPNKPGFNPRQFKGKKQQRGSMLLIAVFVITVMVFLAVTIQDLLSRSSEAVAYEVYGARGLNAANSGAEIALQKIFNLKGQTPLSFTGAGTSASPASATLTLNSTAFVAANLGCSVVVEVIKFAVIEATYYYDYTHYRVQSTASCAAGGFSTVRTVAVEGRDI